MPAATLKRDRSASTNKVLEASQPDAKHYHVDVDETAVEPMLAHVAGETKREYFNRFAAMLSPNCIFTKKTEFDADGIYIYKRPVRSADPSSISLLAQAGSLFHHVVVYVCQSGVLKALEFGPANGMDITNNMMAEAQGDCILKHDPELPEPQHLPMLHIATDHLPLDSSHVSKAVAFAESKPYQALTNNCIAFADFIVRVLTKGAVRSSPLIYDHLCGEIPVVDSPMLALLNVMAQVTWFHVVDGSRLFKQFLEHHNLNGSAKSNAMGHMEEAGETNVSHDMPLRSRQSSLSEETGQKWEEIMNGGDRSSDSDSQGPNSVSQTKEVLKALPSRKASSTVRAH